MNSELDLLEEIRNIINGTNKSTHEYNVDLLKNCRKMILEYKNNGLTQYDAYNKIMVLYKFYDKNNMETEKDFVADILDIICGYIGNKDWLIWNEYYNGNKNG